MGTFFVATLSVVSSLSHLQTHAASCPAPVISHFRRSGPPAIGDTYSLLVLNITFRTTADDLFPLFDKYSEVVHIYIPRGRRTGGPRGFAFVRYKYVDETQKAVDRLDGRVVDGREIMVQFAKYGPNAERIHKGRIAEAPPMSRSHSRSRSPKWRCRDDYWDRDHHRRRSRNRSRERCERDRYRDRDYHRQSRCCSYSSYDCSRRGRDRSPSHSISRSPRRTPSSREGSPRRRYDDCSPRSHRPKLNIILQCITHS